MRWILPPNTNQSIADLLYSKRNIQDKEKFFNPKVEDLYNPLFLHDMDKAVKIISTYIAEKKKIFIHGDFDVDGISATSLLWSFLYRELNANVLPYIPNRFTQGYGLSEESINSIIDLEGDLIITVDCGVKDIELVNKYSDKIKFIITDHHTLLTLESEVHVNGGKQVNEFIVANSALAVVHPKLNNYPFKELCGAAVAWKLCSALNITLNLGLDMEKYIDLAALGTVCDVMPLVDENRIIVVKGIKQIKSTTNIGLKTFIDELKIDKNKIDTYHIGFIIGPRLNASGRMGDAIDAVRLLTTKSSTLAKTLLKKLNNLNSLRQDLTQEYLLLAEKQIVKQKDSKLYLVYGLEWPEGIIGLIAGKLIEKYNRPVIVGSLKNDRVKASARSVDLFHISNNLSKLAKHLISYGGHAQAAGLTFKLENLDYIFKELAKQSALSISDDGLEKKIVVDAVLTNRQNLNEVAKLINKFGPFGHGNPKPKLAIMDVRIMDFKFIGKDKKHLKIKISNDFINMECLIFNCSEEFIMRFNQYYSTLSKIDIVGNLELENWNGNEKVIFFIEDIKFEEK